MNKAAAVSSRALNRALLARQHLLARASGVAPLGMMRALAAVQAQLPRPPFVGLHARLEGFDRGALLVEVRARRLVRATAMRATIHLMATDDWRRWRGALAPVLERAAWQIARTLGDDDLARAADEGREFFAAGPATFDALRDHLAPRWGERVRLAAYAARMRVPLVQVPDDGAAWGWSSAVRFTTADAWLGDDAAPDAASGDDARELVRRYLAAFGPATPADASCWTGLTGMRAVFDALRDELVELRDERGRALFDLPDAPRPPEDAPAPPRLLPEFDGAVLGHDDRARIVDDHHRPRLVTKNLLVPATFLVDGMVAGTWSSAVKRRTATLTLAPFGDRPRAADRRALEQEAERTLRFVEPGAGDYAVVWADSG